MKALSIKQPWASLIVSGRKTIELRTWATRHRGPLVVLAGGKPRKGTDFEIGPLGVVLGVVDIVDCRPAVASDAQAACTSPSEREFAWVLGNARACRPVAFKGRLGFIELEPEILREAGIIV